MEREVIGPLISLPWPPGRKYIPPIVCDNYHIYIPFVRTTIPENSFYYQRAAVWNLLDPSLYSSTTLATYL